MIERTEVDGIAVVTLAHGKVNALDLELVTALTETFRGIASGGHRAVVVTGAGRSFSAGVDLKRIVDGGAEYVRAYVPALAAAFEALFAVPAPVVAAVNGHAIAGGCVLACACDHRVMAAGSGRIGVPELLVGVAFPTAALEIMNYAMGPRAARAAILRGQVSPAEEAVAAGFVDETVEPGRLLEHALAVADRRAAATPADTYAFTKAQLQSTAREALARRAPETDAEVVRLWERRATDGTIAGYLERTVGQRS